MTSLQKYLFLEFNDFMHFKIRDGQ